MVEALNGWPALGPNMIEMQGAVPVKRQEAVDRAVRNSPPPLDDVGGVDPLDFDTYDMSNPYLVPGDDPGDQDFHFADVENPAVADIFQKDSTDALLIERGKTHGDFCQQSAIAQALKMAIRRGTTLEEKWRWELASFQREALEMIAHKIARILAGDPNFADHWDDIAGYAKLVADRVR